MMVSSRQDSVLRLLHNRSRSSDSLECLIDSVAGHGFERDHLLIGRLLECLGWPKYGGLALIHIVMDILSARLGWSDHRCLDHLGVERH